MRGHFPGESSPEDIFHKFCSRRSGTRKFIRHIPETIIPLNEKVIMNDYLLLFRGGNARCIDEQKDPAKWQETADNMNDAVTICDDYPDYEHGGGIQVSRAMKIDISSYFCI